MGLFATIFGGDAQVKAAKKNVKESKAAQADSLGYVEPYATAGKNALTEYLSGVGLGDSNAAIERFKASPEYLLNFETAMDEGRQGVDSVAQAGGLYNSGQRLKALQDRGVETSNRFLSDYLKRLGGVSDMGFNAAGNQANIRTGGAANIMNARTGLADARTSQYQGFDSLLSTPFKFAGFSNPFGESRSIY
jgi:hypothetical protein